MRYTNDKSAPRLGKAEFSTSIVSDELYEKWKLAHPEASSLSKKEFLNIWDSITDKIQYEATNNPQGVKLAFNCGDIRIQYIPKVLKAIDVSSSNAIGEAVPFLNITSKGKVAKISWVRKAAARFNPQILLFAFKHTRKIATKASKAIFSKPEIFRNSNIKINDKPGDDL